MAAEAYQRPQKETFRRIYNDKKRLASRLYVVGGRFMHFNSAHHPVGQPIYFPNRLDFVIGNNRFIGSSSHRQAVRRGGIPADTVRSVVIEIPASHVPVSWKEAKRLLTESKTEKNKDL